MNKRAVLAMVLCFGILVAWTWVQNKFWPPPKPLPKAVATAPAPAPGPPATPVEKPAPTPSDLARAQYPELPPVVLQSDTLKVAFTNRGAGIKELSLRYPEPDTSALILTDAEERFPHLALRDVDGRDPIESAPWELTSQAADRVEFRYRLLNGVVITKEFRLQEKRHGVTLTLSLENKNPIPDGQKEPPPQTVKLELLALNGMRHDNSYKHEQYLHGVVRYKQSVEAPFQIEGIEKGEKNLEQAQKLPPGSERDEAIKDAQKYTSIDGNINGDFESKEWFGLRNRFFTAIVVPDETARKLLNPYVWHMLPEAARKRGDGLKNLTVSARFDAIEVRGGSRTMQLTGFFAPLDEEPLKEVPGGARLLNYGGGCSPLAGLVSLIAPVILGVLKFLAGLFGNYGVGIIATTLVIRLCLFPLSLKSQKSMFAMQQLGPKIQDLRARYKDDQQKFGLEQMRLFRENKVNPMAGCFPLLLQMPIFIGMYSVFEMAIDLRQRPFVGWIRDLSLPDRLMGPWPEWKFLILSIDALNLLPILMTITWWLQAYLTPRSPDPQMAAQQKMMLLMPVVFGLMCYSLASGLSLYFLTNSLLGMGEQRLIKRFFLKPPVTPAAA